MGFEIIYCSVCSKRLGQSDFEKGGARKVGMEAACKGCLPKLLETLGPQAAPAEAEPPKRAPTTPPRPTRVSKAVKQAPAPAPLPPPKKGIPKIAVGIGASVLVGIIVIAAVMMKSTPPPPEVKGPSDTSVNPPPDQPKITAAAAADPKKDAYEKACRFAEANPNDLEGKIAAYEEALKVTGESPFFRMTQQALQPLKDERDLRSSKARDDFVAALEKEVAADVAKEAYGAAVKRFEAALDQYESKLWKKEIQQKIDELRHQAREAYEPLRVKAGEAKAARKADVEKQIREQIARWGIDELKTDLHTYLDGIAVGGTPTPPPPTNTTPTPPPPVVKVTPEVAAYRKRWSEAAALATAGDFDGAVQAFTGAAGPEAAADLEHLKALKPMVEEARGLLKSWPADKELSLSLRQADGSARPVKGKLAWAGPERGEMAGGGFVEWSDATLASLVRLLKNKQQGAAPEPVRRRWALLCLLEGDVNAAKELLGGGELDEKQVLYAAGAAARIPKVPPREAEARALYYKSEEASRRPDAMAEALEGFARLKKDYADTKLVAGELKTIERRLAAGQEYLFAAEDLSGRGKFIFEKREEVGACWKMKEESTYQSENFVEFSFFGLAGTEYQCWVRLGGCCQEVFASAYQATGLSIKHPTNKNEKMAVEPGSDNTAPVSIAKVRAPKTHASHAKNKEPKTPAKWEWVVLDLPKYDTAGSKTVRIYSTQQGFGVAGALVSATRKMVPTDKELAKMVAEQAADASRRPRPDGTILCERYTGIGGSALAELTKNAKFPDKPDDTTKLTSFEIPAEWADNYGTRVRGYLFVPSSGEYRFLIAGDDECELLLSDTDRPEGAKQICHQPNASGRKQWGEDGKRRSQPIRLEAGRRYYIEARQKEGSGGDHLAIGWEGPGVPREVIPGKWLSSPR